jgi:hypothetical protein
MSQFRVWPGTLRGGGRSPESILDRTISRLQLPRRYKLLNVEKSTCAVGGSISIANWRGG